MPVHESDVEKLAAIVTHLDDCIRGCQTALDGLAPFRAMKSNTYIQGQVRYWQNAMSALTWAKRLAMQTHGQTEYGRDAQIQQSGADPSGGRRDTACVDDS